MPDRDREQPTQKPTHITVSSLQLRSRSRAPSSAHRPPTAPLSAPSQPGGRAEAADASGVRLTGRLGAVAIEHDGDPHEDLVGVRVGVRVG
eukprot:scaffold19208_cov73-Phaeocystis_antarctica.AAC.3